ncbi:prefoldin subunit alpha [Candidatus Woesearchaeota archaeon]|nr:prefoldin subunit alpha [Candidatus Woesearchaeota archaeon]
MVEKNKLSQQVINERVSQVEEQLIKVESQIQEFQRIINDLDEYSKISEDSELLAPIANGIFVKAKKLENNSFFVNIGGGVVAKKSLSSTKELMTTQLTSLEEYREELFSSLNDLLIMNGGV